MKKKSRIKFPEAKKVIVNDVNQDVRRFPFYVKAVGFSSDRTLALEKEVELSDHLFLYMVSGNATLHYQGMSSSVRESSIVFISCTSSIKLVCQGLKRGEYFWVLMGGGSTKLYYNIIRTQKHSQKISALSPIPDIMVELFNVKYDGSINSHIRSSHLIQELLYQAYLISFSIGQAKKKVPAQDTEVRRAISYIEKNYSKRLTIDSICNEICLSKYYFCKIFKVHTGQTLLGYLNQYRVNESKNLLIYSKLSIESIALTVGFANSLTYIRNFKSVTEMTPSEFRRNNQ